MKRIVKILWMGIIALTVFSGCEDVAKNVKLPPVEKKIVVQCFISPDDDFINALVSWSKPVVGSSLDDEPEYIITAKVEISDGTNTGIMLWDESMELYVLPGSSFPIEAGKKYFLTVSLPDGKKVTSTCQVPLTQNKTFVLSKIDSLEEDTWGTTLITCTFKYKDHEPSVKNYYRVDGSPKLYDFDEELGGEFKEDSEFQTDYLFKLSFYESAVQFSRKANAWIINGDYNYYMYHKTLQGAQRNFGLFSEPSIVYSNIEGGIGCFGAYNSYGVEVDL